MSFEQEQESPGEPRFDLEQFLELAKAKFWSKYLIIGPGGHIEIYGLFGAVDDALEQMSTNPSKVIGEVIKQSRINPSQIRGLDEVVGAETWEQLFAEITRRILAEELFRSDPRISSELHRRFQEESRLDYG